MIYQKEESSGEINKTMIVALAASRQEENDKKNDKLKKVLAIAMP